MPDFRFFDADTETLIDESVAAFEESLEESTNEADERRILLMAYLAVLNNVGGAVNAAGQRLLLRSATGSDLDAIGETLLTRRLPALAATAQIEFTLSMERPQNTLIPKGCRATPDGELFFATDTPLMIPAGMLIGTVSATCEMSGIVGNGYMPGSITTLVDPVPFVDAVRNTLKTTGGSEAEADDNYRERIRTAPVSFSTAGSVLSYEYWARSAHAGIVDLYIHSPGPARVEIVALVADGVPEGEVLDAVLEACSDSTRRPLTDLVSVRAAEPVDYNIAIKYYAPASTLPAVQAAVEGEGGALARYIAWQSAELGRTISPNQLLVYLTGAGAVRVDIDAPTYAALAPDQVARLNAMQVESAILTM